MIKWQGINSIDIWIKIIIDIFITYKIMKNTSTFKYYINVDKMVPLFYNNNATNFFPPPRHWLIIRAP